jgi:DNA repair/transcription protein MET18/MMS19
VPPAIITPSLPQLLPLLLQAIELPDADVKAATISTLEITIAENAEVVKEHVAGVITRLLKAACMRGDEHGNTPQVRMRALRCIRAFPGRLRAELLLPYKRRVLKELQAALDDPKRAVRKEAVDTRVKWWALGDPEE